MIGNVFRFIDRRLWLRVLFPLSIIVLIVVGISTWYNVTSQSKSSEMLLKNQNTITSKVVEGGMFDALAVGDNDVVRAQFKRLNETLKDLKVFVYDFNGVVSFSTDIDTVGKNVDTFMDDISKSDLTAMLTSGRSSDNAFSVSLDQTSFLLKNTPILNDARCFHCHGEKRKVLGGISVFSSESEVKQAIVKNRTNSILIGVGGLAMIVLFIWFFFNFMVNKKINLVLDAMSYLRNRDFSHSYDVEEGDEVNHILARINLVTQNLRETIGEIVDNSGTINDSAGNLSQISENLNSASTDLSEKAITVSAAAEEMSANNNSVASSMEQSTETLNDIAGTISELSATVSNISENVHSSKEITTQVVEGFDTISGVVEELGQRANDVDEITNDISSIAEQVSMLALNAKIESARAGDAGKGFAVVAAEISDLANQTNESTALADEKLNWIKEKTRAVAEQVAGLTSIINESDQAITSISSAVAQQDATTKEISKHVNDISSEIADMNTNVTDGASVASEIAKEITIVENGSRQVQENSYSLNDNAAALLSMAEKFTALVNKFKI